jgi:hypothetical protein
LTGAGKSKKLAHFLMKDRTTKSAASIDKLQVEQLGTHLSRFIAKLQEFLKAISPDR